MCGICGLVVPEGMAEGKSIKDQVNKMVDALMHRGPDDTGIHGDHSAIFGMTRLAIRGLNDGKQPIIDRASGVMMACNGEIDNHLELREWLIDRGRTVEQSTDVAVIPAMYLELGDAFVERLKGAFAIAIWDPREKKILLARDRAGERPLFYAINDGIVAFASLIAALVSPGSHAYNISTNAVHGYLQSGFFVAPETPFKDIQKVTPGEVLTIDATGIQRRRYWYWNVVKTTKKAGSLDMFDEVFRASVRRQSEVDVDFGLFLSGGLDSSLITAVTRSIRPEKTLKAYSLRFSEASYDEGHYAEQVANTLGVEFVPVWVRPEDFPPTIAKLVRQVGEPLADPAWVPSALLASRAAQDVRVALVGEGADELFGGYPTYFGAGLAGYYARLPDPVRTLIRRAVESWPASDKKVTIPFLLKRFIQGDELDYLGRHILWTSCISPAILTRLGVTPPLIRRPSYLSAEMLDRLQQHDLETSLAEGLLTKADRASMKSALELRAPFLDQEVMEFAATLPEEERIHRLQTKVFLKQYALRYLPKEIVHRKKRGLSVPLSSWLREPLYEWAKSRLSSPLLDRVGVNRYVAVDLLQEHMHRKADHARSIWTLIVLSEWLEWVSEVEAGAQIML
ncbi:MAG: asparagine synthase (glutamine-hydrolyzing) [Methylococcaceae bacterium]|nr:asparagine synthase (glutamine-hydrolyzing) [Methylococcaceae bacterium]